MIALEIQPSLGLMVEVNQQAGQLHIHDSSICGDGGPSGCVFFSGFLQGLLGPAVLSSNLSIFSVCCRSFGAGECFLAIPDEKRRGGTAIPMRTPVPHTIH